MKKIFKKLVVTLLLLFLIYYSSIVISLYNFHKGIYNNQKNFLEKYVNFTKLKKNLTFEINNIIQQALKNNTSIDPATKLLAFTLSKSLNQNFIKKYVNKNNLSSFLEQINNDKIPKPNLLKTYLIIVKINFVNLDNFFVNYENNGESIPIYFERNLFHWKLTNIKLDYEKLKRVIKF
tara:strand:+ start:4704 stop:5237 length:534 start_codon:yes stop_codon:yes gene_type:complete